MIEKKELNVGEKLNEEKEKMEKGVKGWAGDMEEKGRKGKEDFEREKELKEKAVKDKIGESFKNKILVPLGLQKREEEAREQAQEKGIEEKNKKPEEPEEPEEPKKGFEKEEKGKPEKEGGKTQPDKLVSVLGYNLATQKPEEEASPESVKHLMGSKATSPSAAKPQGESKKKASEVSGGVFKPAKKLMEEERSERMRGKTQDPVDNPVQA